jgi:hypothetical protein
LQSRNITVKLVMADSPKRDLRSSMLVTSFS